MDKVWAVIVAAGLLLAVYGIVSSKLKNRRQKKEREKTLPFVADNVKVGVTYNVYMSDGKKYLCVQLLGTTDESSGAFTLGWGGMLVMRNAEGKRVFVRQYAVRCVEEI